MSKQFVVLFSDHDPQICWVVVAPDQHSAIVKAVEAGFGSDIVDFYCGLSDGQISIIEINKTL